MTTVRTEASTGRHELDGHRARRSPSARALMLALALLAVPGRADAGSLELEWAAPTTNVDGTPLTDLAAYRIYTGSSAPPCPGSGYQTLAALAPSPLPGETVPAWLTGLTAGTTYWVRITAVDTSGNESPCTPAVSGVANADADVTPGALNFGSVAVGTAPTLDLTIQNFGATSLTGTATTAPPFSIVAGGTLNVAAGASQVVRVAFAPPAEQVFGGTVTLATSADVLARPVSGSGVVATPAVLQFSQATYAVTEGGVVEVTVTRSGGPHGGVSVDYATGGGTATAGVDYAAASGRLTFAAGVTTQTFSIKTSRDKRAEGAETIALALSNPQGGAVLGAQPTATVTVNEKVASGGRKRR